MQTCSLAKAKRESKSRRRANVPVVASVRATKSALGRIPSLDGIRAIAITLVLLTHVDGTQRFPTSGSFNSLIDLGHVGVTVFFVISGFLISNLLFAEQECTGTIDLARFYLRRTLRIFPAYYGFVAVIGVSAWFGWIQLQKGDLTVVLNVHYELPPRSSVVPWARLVAGGGGTVLLGLLNVTAARETPRTDSRLCISCGHTINSVFHMGIRLLGPIPEQPTASCSKRPVTRLRSVVSWPVRAAGFGPARFIAGGSLRPGSPPCLCSGWPCSPSIVTRGCSRCRTQSQLLALPCRSTGASDNPAACSGGC